MNKDKKERLNDFLCSLSMEVLKEAGLFEDKIEDEPKVKEVERFTREEFSNELAGISQRTAGWILRLFNNRVGKIFFKKWIRRKFRETMIEQMEEMKGFLGALGEGLDRYKNTLHKFKDTLTEDLDLIDKTVHKQKGKKPIIH